MSGRLQERSPAVRAKLPTMNQRGFIFQATSLIRGGRCELRFHGRLENGGAFRIGERRAAPRFYVRNLDAGALTEAGWRGAMRGPTDKTDFQGELVAEVEMASPAQVQSLCEQLRGRGIPTYEADLDLAVRHLIDRNIKGGCEISGQGRPGSLESGVDWLFDEPELAAAEVGFKPRVLSFDIETDGQAKQLLAIALYGCGADEVYVVDAEQRPMPERAVGCATEAEALAAFRRRVQELDVDVLTGWNVIDFDLSVLARLAARSKTPFDLGRGPGRMRLRPARGYFGRSSATIPGRLVLDGISLLRGAFVRMSDYSLDAVARAVLEEGKALTGDAPDRLGEILRNYAADLPAFVRYARTDARLALEVVEKLDLINLAVARSRLTGMMPDRVSASIAAFDFLYLAELGKRRRVAPTLALGDERPHQPQSGGHVLSPTIGLHKNVWVFDFKSLYPNIIRTYNLDPLGFIPADTQAQDPITAPNGARFRRDPGVLPQLLDRLAPEREQAKKDGDAVAAQAIKILMNSFYGVLGAYGCRFYNPDISNAITSQGKRLLLWSKGWFERRGFQVLYGDTDSLFVSAGQGDGERALAQGPQLAAALTEELAAFIKEEAGLTSRLELEFEKLYARLFLPHVRSGAGGARKRYAGLIRGRAAPEFVGMEVVRRDWTDLAKETQRALYERFFRDEPVDGFLRSLVAALRTGELDHQLIYRKGLRKAVGAYQATTPPHVAAARKSKAPAGRIVSYVMTLAGPEPLDNQTELPDREHYVHKQIRPVAEPVLEALGLNFKQVIGDDKQLNLF